jgi:1,2-diacylglycerol 3-alpha-glucosyltransferase
MVNCNEGQHLKRRAGTEILSICIFSNLFPPVVSGSSMFTRDLAHRLSERGHRVTVITAQVETALREEAACGIDVYRLPAIRLPRLPIAHNFKWMTYTFTPRNLEWLRRFFAKGSFDVLHQQNHVFDTILSSSRMARRHNLPLVLTVHTFAQHPNRFFNTLLVALDALARRVVFDNADVVVSPDPVVKEYVETRHRVSNSVVIPYGIEVPTVRSVDAQAIRQRYGLDSGPVVLSLGHVNLLRDRVDLIQAMPLVIQRFPEARLLIVGEVCVKQPIELVKRLGLEDHVIFTGSVPHSQVPAFFALSALEAHTVNSDFPGPGVASMEAMAAGLPVITGEIDARYDFSHFHNWENLVTVPPNRPDRMADALIQLLSDEQLRRRIGENARGMIAQHYSWDAVCEAYLRLYRQIIEQHRQGRVGQA